VPGTENGSIRRCNIYTSNTAPGAGKEVSDITDWELAYTNVKVNEDGTVDTSEDWPEYNGALSALGNASEALFNGFKDARYVRMEVINTQGSGTENKWINIGRVYIYEAEAVYTGAVENVALSSSNASVVAYTGSYHEADTGNDFPPGYAINGAGNTNNSKVNMWIGTAELRDENKTPYTNGEVSYMVVDLGEDVVSVDLEEIQVRFHNQAWASKYMIQTSEKAPSVTGDVMNSDTLTESTPTLDWLNQTDW